MTRVLEFNINGGGTLSIVKNIILNCKADIKFDIAALGPFESSFEEETLKNNNVIIYFLGNEGNIIKKRYLRCKNLAKLLKQNKYDCIHLHSDVANVLLLYGVVSKLCGVPKVIFHSHSTSIDDFNNRFKRFLHLVCRRFLKLIGSDFCACSKEAANWMYPNIALSKVLIIKNAIDLSVFCINDDVRRSVRNQLGYKPDDYVIGHVGRFSYQKNHDFLIDMFFSLHQESTIYKLLLIGTGEDFGRIKAKVEKLKISEFVTFTGNINNVQDYMQAMDIFVLPSRFEGLPLVGIEAQACGLPVIYSDKITNEAKIIDNVWFMSIDDTQGWISLINNRNFLTKLNTTIKMKESGFDINTTVSIVTGRYLY